MKFLFKKIYIIFIFLIILSVDITSYAKDSKVKYNKDNLSSYFSGIVSSKKYNSINAYENLKKVQTLKDKHSTFSIEFIRTLILLDKFNQAFDFAKSVQDEKDTFFEADLLLGLNFFIKEDYKNAEKHFKKLNRISIYNIYFDDFIGNFLIAWTRAVSGEKSNSFKVIDEIPDHHNQLKKMQVSFLNCYFDNDKTQSSFEELIQKSDYNFSRYNFFLINYLLTKNDITAVSKIIKKALKKNSSNLLIKETEFFLLNNERDKIYKMFNCKNPRDSLAEFFYVIANLYSNEKYYQMSNFYLKISLFLNKNFLPNKSLLAENFYYQKKLLDSKKMYNSLKSLGPNYSWYASKSIATISIEKNNKITAISNLENEFKQIPKKSFMHYYDLANFYKDNSYHEKSIEYYTKALQKIKKDHVLFPKILDRRGTSYEKLGDWKNSEQDLKDSLKILPDQPYVLNYLAYTWIDKGMHLDKALKMLTKAVELKSNDGYIIDSLGWAYYLKNNYKEAEKYLQRAVELIPLDPIINDHYADSLWMQNKKIQARYIWHYVYKLDDLDQKLKDKISEKILFGINKKL